MKRGSSGLSLVVGVNKPSGMSSHDVVNRCRRIFGERRVGHTGTLDPLASGVLPICIGPATRLDQYLTSNSKRYRVVIGFGCETDTDDREGQVTARGVVQPDLLDGGFAAEYVSGLVGEHDQVPPAYSAIKVNGQKAYEKARCGEAVELETRPIEIFEAILLDRSKGDVNTPVLWTLELLVSKGTYIRAIARDIGRELGSYAHVVELERIASGALGLDCCVSLETLEQIGVQAALDPLRLMGMRFAYGDDLDRFIQNGVALYEGQVELHEFVSGRAEPACACCMTDIISSTNGPLPNERVALVAQNRLKAIYRFDAESGTYKSECVFSIGVTRN